MKKIYEAPSTEIIAFLAKDIITVSMNDAVKDDTKDDWFENVEVSWVE